MTKDNTKDTNKQNIQPISINDEMKKSYMDYAMSVIVSRALPDVRDGLKPVHRRILYAMKEGGYESSKPFRKSARIIGDVMGKYHPHGDQAIYDAMVRMVQDFSMRLPLVSGQGNFGSVDGDPPAAMRYTEARLAKSAEALLDDIDKQTVSFKPNYDESALEPEVLPARYPNILVNGGGGIAVGMATNIPPHNLGEVIDASIALLKKPTMDLREIMEIVEAPDFPTGGIIMGRHGIQKAFMTGNGSVVIRSRTHMETIRKEREAIIVTEIPYQVNKSRLLERIAETSRDKIIDGLFEVRDESDRDGMRIVLELKRDAKSQIVLNQLFKHTPLQQSFGINMLALRDGMPEMLPILEMIRSFLKFRDATIIKRTRFLLEKARTRVHILSALLVAISNIDEIINTIKSAKDTATAKADIMNKQWKADMAEKYIILLGEHKSLDSQKMYRLSEAQAKAILELRLQRLTGMEREKLEEESQELAEKIKTYLSILGDDEVRRQIIIDELEAIKKEFATPRRTTVEEGEYTTSIEDLIEREEMVVTVTHNGYVKRVPLATYRTQKRGGKGRGAGVKQDDFAWKIFIADTLTPILFFTSKGKVYEKKVYHIPEVSPTARGKALVNFLPFKSDERVTAIMPMPADMGEWGNLYVMFATAAGKVRRNKLSDFTNIQSNGKIAMKLHEGDSLVSVEVCSDDQDVLLATAKGRAIRFPVTRKRGDIEKGVRVFSGRSSSGVRGIKLKDGDRVISMGLLKNLGELMLEDSDEGSNNINHDYLLAVNAAVRLKVKDHAKSDSEDAKRDKSRVQKLGIELFKKMQGNEQFILSISSSGFGQLCSAYGYRQTSRAGAGINNMQIQKGDEIISSYLVAPHGDELVLITDGAQIIRISVKGVRKISRDSKGIRLVRMGAGEKIISCARIDAETVLQESGSGELILHEKKSG